VTCQSALDAKADAETLFLFMRSGRHFCGLSYPLGWMLGVMDLGGGTKKAIRAGQQYVAQRRAIACARAAFDAVPGLRGGE
jgi:hypothetical protein